MEELIQRGYLRDGDFRGDPYGNLEEFNLGSTSVATLDEAGLRMDPVESMEYPFKLFKPTKKPRSTKPDRVWARRAADGLHPVAVGENKGAKGLSSEDKLYKAAEQGLHSALALGGVPIAVITDGKSYHYVDVESSINKGEIAWFEEDRDLNPTVLRDLQAGDAGTVKDPTALAETVWQTIWHATKAEPKDCLLTFVEIFVLKFLSDNLPHTRLPANYKFYELIADPADFKSRHGVSQIEYYVGEIRPKIKELFPKGTPVDPDIASIFGVSRSITSPTSIINGFIFGTRVGPTLRSFDRTFRTVLKAFDEFGSLRSIDPEFKLRLYETFLRRSARQQSLGQFFTPRNVVQPMVRMAKPGSYPNGSVALDPASGVGGFVLEPLIIDDDYSGNYTFEKGRSKARITTIGLDVDENLHILAKANMLLHLAEAVRDPATTLDALNHAMANTFLLMNENATLGSLRNPPEASVDLIMTNPPYVTRGSAVYRQELAEVGKTVNGMPLRTFYEGAGLGVEALFLRYIVKALKPGGRAFVVVPHGLLNRTETGPKQAVLDECNVLASIQLPRNTFFNTAQKTYILVLEKRYTEADDRPDVLCGLARTIGESLDWRRDPEPNDNDLSDIADLFLEHDAGKDITGLSPVVKVVGATDFQSDDRWDVVRFWTDEELVTLGERPAPVSHEAFIDEATDSLQQLVSELNEAREEINELTSGSMKTFSLGDSQTFDVRSGTRIKTSDIKENPGDIVVYSCFREAHIEKGRVSKKWLLANGYELEKTPTVTINANGASVGRVFVRPEGCLLTDDVVAVRPLVDSIHLEYLAVAAERAVAAAGFLYEAKAFKTRIKELTVEVPVDENGDPDLAQQKLIASAMKRFANIRRRLGEVGEWSSEARIA